VDHLLAAGHTVRVFDRGPERYRSPLAQVEYRLSNFDDIQMLTEALEGIDIVYHLISTSVPSTGNVDPIGDIRTNLVATVRMLQIMNKKQVNKIIYLSSGGTVYGTPGMLPIPETHPLRPTCSYGIVKVAIENYLYMFHKLIGLEYVVVRPSNAYGERQGHHGVQGVIGTFLRKALRNEKIEIWGDGSVVRDYLYVGDLARLCTRIGDNFVTTVVNSGSGIGYSIRDVVAVIESTVGNKLNVLYKPAREFDIQQVVLDCSKAQKMFSWSPSVNLVEGIKRTWYWLQGF
jgi:UDP-glucose 4-epimerase